MLYEPGNALCAAQVGGGRFPMATRSNLLCHAVEEECSSSVAAPLRAAEAIEVFQYLFK